jgi:SAM-dependent methyltransferase
MRYKLRNFEIRSENAAKPTLRPSKTVVEWIKRMHSVKSILDLGCGKLRYARYLAEKCNHLDLVDSLVQIERHQMIGNQRTTVKNYTAKYLSNSDVYCIQEFLEKPRRKYDLVLCANMISAIPSKPIRTKTLRSVLTCLKTRGRILVVNQYTNSYFKRVINSVRATPHLDGYILYSDRGIYYYGILPEKKMARILLGCGFRVIDTWRSGQSSFVLAGRK